MRPGAEAPDPLSCRKLERDIVVEVVLRRRCFGTGVRASSGFGGLIGFTTTLSI